MHYNILKILICIVQQNASYPQMYPQKILLPIFALLMAWAMHNIRGNVRQEEGLFFEVAPCDPHRDQQPTCRIRLIKPNWVAIPYRCCRQGQRATFTQKSTVSAGVHQLKRSDRQGERIFHNLLEL